LALYGILEDVTVDYGDTLHLTCPVYSGNDLVITEWYKNTKLIAVQSGLYFTIVSHHRDAGMYYCVTIQGDQRVTSNTMRVNVRGIL